MRQRKIQGIRVITPTTREFQRIARAIHFLVRKSKSDLARVRRSLQTIDIVPGRIPVNTVSEKDRTWTATQAFLETCPPVYLASLLLHEAFHVEEFHKGKLYRAAASEKDAYLIQRSFLIRYANGRYTAWLDRQYKRKWWRKQEKLARKLPRHLRGRFTKSNAPGSLDLRRAPR